MVTTLEIFSPHNQRSTVQLGGRRAIVGRPTPGNEPDVALDDPRRWVSRQHCALEVEDDEWHVTDQGTDNGTFLRHDGVIERAVGRVRLRDGDAVCLLGDRRSDGTPLYWELGLLPSGHSADPYQTVQVPPQATGDCVDYDPAQARLFRCGPQRAAEIGLTGNEHKLVGYMADRNQQYGGVAVACRKEELLRAVWGDPQGDIPFGVDEQNLRDLVGGLRRKLDPDSMDILETVHDFGYRLWTCERDTHSAR